VTVCRSRPVDSVSDGQPEGRVRSARQLLTRSDALVRLARATRVIPGRLTRSRSIADYLAGSGSRLLQLGAEGPPLPGWLCVDHRPRHAGVVYVHGRRRLPFNDAVFDCIFSEHFLEHFTWVDGAQLLAECWRVLKPGGTLRITTPDLAIILSLYNGADDPDNARYIIWQTDQLGDAELHTPQFAINLAFYGYGHRFLYDGGAIELALGRAGFVDIERLQFGESREPQLSGIDSHSTFVTMVYEARRPRPGCKRGG
jgi:predicted SAM-dependent methyltransferase